MKIEGFAIRRKARGSICCVSSGKPPGPGPLVIPFYQIDVSLGIMAGSDKGNPLAVF
jgi:hypothetical protein